MKYPINILRKLLWIGTIDWIVVYLFFYEILFFIAIYLFYFIQIWNSSLPGNSSQTNEKRLHSTQ